MHDFPDEAVPWASAAATAPPDEDVLEMERGRLTPSALRISSRTKQPRRATRQRWLQIF